MLLIPTHLKHSPIHGMGVFAAEFIPKGTIIWEFVPGLDLILSAETLERMPYAARAQIEDYLYESEFFPGGQVLNADSARYINHSNTPNTDNSGAQTLALRDIVPGEEITCDYRELNTSYEALPYVGKRAMIA